MTTTEKCPTCKGECCVNKHGNPAAHGSVLAMHSCPDCDAGLVWTAYTETMPRPVRTAEDERADVLAYLAYARAFPFTYATSTADILDALRELIEQGQHIGWAKK
jgi:hypothetical protein